MFNTLLFEIKNKIAMIVLNRLEVYNAFNDEMSFELQDALKQVTKDKTIRVVVLTGAGEKAFCSGQDLKADRGSEVKSFSDSVNKRYNPVIRAIRALPKPVICRLNGVAAGAGASLALACDIIIASENASLVEVFVNIGLVPDSGSSFFLARALSYQKAFELATTGNKISAKEAAQLGLINKVVNPEALDAAVESVTGFYANAPTKAIGLIKKMLQKGTVESLDALLDYE
ncbi:MAG: enoyl-CoA hydratase-related protein, partial [Chitinophagaceae bacterium]